MSVIVVELLGDAVPKERPRHNRKSGAVYTPVRTRAYEKQLAFAAMAARGTHKVLAGAVAMRITVVVKIPRSFKGANRQNAIEGIVAPIGRPDLDNLIKTAKDALNGVIYKDDSQVCDIVARKEYGEQAKIRIEICSLDLEYHASIYRPLKVDDLPLIGEAA